MIKTISLTALLCSFFVTFSQNLEDVEVRRNYESVSKDEKCFYINQLNENAIKKIEGYPERENMLTILGQKTTQGDFDLLCKRMNWVKRLKIEVSKNPQLNRNIEKIYSLKALEELEMVGSYSKLVKMDVLPLQKINNLKKITLLRVDVVHSSALKNHPHLSELVCSGRQMDMSTFIEENNQIEKLILHHASSTDYSSIAKMKKLKSLKLVSIEGKANIEKLNSLTQLKEFEIVFSIPPIHSLDFLKNNSGMEKIKLSSLNALGNLYSSLKYFPDLKSFNVLNSPFDELAVLNNNVALTRLELSGSQVHTLYPLKNHLNLEYLNVSNTMVDNIGALYDHTALRELVVSPAVPEEQLKKIKSKIPALKIEVKGSVIPKGIGQCMRVRKQYGQTRYIINDVTPEVIQKLKSNGASELYMSEECSQSDFDLLCSQLGNIKQLLIAGKIDNLKGISNQKELEVVDIRLNNQEQPIDLAPIANLSQLKTIRCQASVINEQALGKCVGLERVVFKELNSIGFLEKLPHVVELFFDENPTQPIKDYSPIASLKKLRIFSLSSDDKSLDKRLKPLKSLTTLSSITIKGKGFKSLSFLENNTGLRTLISKECVNLSDFSVLPHFPSLQNLDVKNTKFDNIHLLEENNSLMALNVANSFIKAIKGIESCVPNLIRLDISKTERLS